MQVQDLTSKSNYTGRTSSAPWQELMQCAGSESTFKGASKAGMTQSYACCLLRQLCSSLTRPPLLHASSIVNSRAYQLSRSGGQPCSGCQHISNLFSMSTLS